MRTRHTRWTTATLLAVVLTAAAAVGTTACSRTGSAQVETGPSPAAETDAQPATATGSTAELEAIYRARTDSARMHFSPADVHFMTGMIGHHAQALVMAALAPTHGASSELRTLAARIINAQKDEIAWMQQWLSDRGQLVPEVEIEGTTLTVHGAEHATHMPGMLTAEQMQELDEGNGMDFDRLFLTYMIQHHQGAVTMVHELFATDGAAQDEAAFKLASDIQVDQLTEIARMKLMLDERSAVGGGS